MQRLRFPLFALIVFGGVALALAALVAAGNSPKGKIALPALLLPSAARHETRTSLQEVIEFSNANEIAPRVETVSWAPPTRSSFMAAWGSVSGAEGYLLDVSTSQSFTSYVDGYHDLDVGNVNGRVVTGLNPGTTYYYRVRPSIATRSGGYSNVTTVTTQPSTGLTIQATFDSSITGDPNAAAIEAMINRAIAIYESLFSDPITINILFRFSTTGPEPGATPYPAGVLATSLSTVYTVSWNSFISALRADATTSNDNSANASLPGSALATNIAPSGGNGRSVGLNTPPAMFADGHIGLGGPFDGIVTLVSAVPYSFMSVNGASGTPLSFPSTGSFQTPGSIETTLTGLIPGSNNTIQFSNPIVGDWAPDFDRIEVNCTIPPPTTLRPQDLFSWSSHNVRNLTLDGSRYFSIDSGSTDIVGF